MTGRNRWYDPLTRTSGGGRDHGSRPARDPAVDTPTPIGAIAEQLVTRREWRRRLEGSQIHALWERIAGQAVAEHVRPVRLLGGVLVLEADSGAWATQVRYLTQGLAERANAELGADLVERIQITSAGRNG
jgi:predicted nucleic acid-binding Zn ribbon protein